ncbi:MAG: hypothetical protein IT487_12980 [Chromatiaceae bacterium]|nr:hypothetical protein [Chromatiaceae bacterium]
MNEPMTTPHLVDPVASLLAGQADLGLAALTVKILGVDPQGPDEDGDLRLTLSYAVTNTTAEDLEYLDIRTQLLTPEGLILDESQDTEQETLPAGQTGRYEVGFWLKAALFGPDLERLLAVIAVTGCDYGKQSLGRLAVPAQALTPVVLPTVTLEPALRLVSGALWRAEPDRDGDCLVEVTCLLRNLLPQYLPEVELIAPVSDKKGREVTNAGTRVEVRPGALTTLHGNGYAKAHQLKGATIELALSGYWPVATGQWAGTLPVRLRGRRSAAAATAGGTGLSLTCTGTMSKAWYNFAEYEDVTIAERQATLRQALEEDCEGTLAGLIYGDLELNELDEPYRQLIALPPEVTVVKPIAVRGDWKIKDGALRLDLEADWVLPLTARPDDEDDLQYALSGPAYDALYVSNEVGWLEYDNDSGGDTSLVVEGDEE